MKGLLIFGLLLLGAHFGLSLPNEHQRIMNGSYAVAKQFPYQVGYDAFILSKNQKAFAWTFICGGTLISKRIILTAAHCFSTPGILAIRIYFGAVDKSNESEIGQEQLVVKRANVVVHEEFGVDDYNDIALIKLPVDVAFNEYIRPAKLPEPGIIYSSEAIISGWGSVGFSDDKNPIYEPELRYSHVEILSHAECKKRLPNAFLVSSRICLVTKNPPCFGDSGGPVAVTHKGDTVLLGLTSYGMTHYCTDEYPEVYTRVASYLNWIHENAGAHNLEV